MSYKKLRSKIISPYVDFEPYVYEKKEETFIDIKNKKDIVEFGPKVQISKVDKTILSKSGLEKILKDIHKTQKLSQEQVRELREILRPLEGQEINPQELQNVINQQIQVAVPIPVESESEESEAEEAEESEAEESEAEEMEKIKKFETLEEIEEYEKKKFKGTVKKLIVDAKELIVENKESLKEKIKDEDVTSDEMKELEKEQENLLEDIKKLETEISKKDIPNIELKIKTEIEEFEELKKMIKYDKKIINEIIKDGKVDKEELKILKKIEKTIPKGGKFIIKEIKLKKERAIDDLLKGNIRRMGLSEMKRIYETLKLGRIIVKKGVRGKRKGGLRGKKREYVKSGMVSFGGYEKIFNPLEEKKSQGKAITRYVQGKLKLIKKELEKKE